ncbi:MAG: hypothetical protein HXS41_00045 [Theionarchaea archaeon]|nr:hypothetical protein [Theionarchaea archaeon]MBU7001360.1 hypothetical protein [Theionarchaea archaeon]MBU7019420.1 hypothetical protein [Theionarchaea archaeon]MBU7034855.1 hypothetical protein [Theionarchaea archaeon]MBU7040407.1 hypothetical protein [Theionarchaea archaeon]
MVTEKNENEDSGKVLTDKKKGRLDRLKAVQRIYCLVLVVGLISISLGFACFVIDVFFNMLPPISPVNYVILLTFGAVALVSAASVGKTKLKSIQEEIQDLTFQIDLLDLIPTPEENRAEKLLRMNQIQLKRYYDLNLSQNYWIFAVGVLCVFLGVGILGAALYLLVYWPESSTWVEKALVGVLGSIGSILTNYVAHVYLGMFSDISKSLTDLHGKLVSTNQSFLANLIASRIDDREKRDDTWAKLALSLKGEQ